MLEGRYYDQLGRPTAELEAVEGRIEAGHAAKALREEHVKQYPGCNSRFRAGEGGEVWCEQQSGTVPRKGKMELDLEARCGCYPPQFAAEHADVLRTYPGCAPDAQRCSIAVEGA